MDPNYIVMVVTLVIWVGIFLYLLSLDKKVKKLGSKNEG